MCVPSPSLLLWCVILVAALFIQSYISLLILHEQNEYKLNTLRILDMWQNGSTLAEPIVSKCLPNIELTAEQFAQLVWS